MKQILVMIKRIRHFLKRFFGHLKTILIHKYWVLYYSYFAGILWQGIIHDLSKFSPVEFFEGVKFWTGSGSPITNCKKVFGSSNAWLHHKGRNKHHYEYWQDNSNMNGFSVQMPFKYAAEMVCDYIAAGRTYMGDNFDFTKEYEWWQSKKKLIPEMHNQTFKFMDMVFERLKDCHSGTEVLVLDKDNLKEIYDKAQEEYERSSQSLEDFWRFIENGYKTEEKEKN